MMLPSGVRHQYASTDPLKVRIETHRHYSEQTVDLDVESARLLALAGDESILDVGRGPGRFLLYLKGQGHQGRLVRLDQSTAMLDEGAEAVSSAGHTAGWPRGTADPLPPRDGVFTWVVARHMLYHVPDVTGAPRELARVAGTDGGVLVSTNGRRSLPLIEELYTDMLDTFGFSVEPSPRAGFGIEDAEPVPRAVFSGVEPRIIANALVFTEAEPVVGYVASTFPSLPIPVDAALRSRMRDWLRGEAGRRIAALGGVWRDPKDVRLYVCRT